MMQRYDKNARPLGMRKIRAGVTTASMRAGTLCTGGSDGSVVCTGPRETIRFKDTSASPVSALLPGPRRTWIVAFVNGDIGLWDGTIGVLLDDAKLHGPVGHLAIRDQTLLAASELGDSMEWDLSDLGRSYGELMKEVARVPVVWENGRPVQTANSSHPR
jgi:hypothetical protein